MSHILITGSTSGIGKAIARQCITDGHHVIGLARNHHKVDFSTDSYTPYAIDFANIANLEQKLKPIVKQHPEISTLICCAGYGEFKFIEQFSVKQMQQLMDVNFLSQAVVIKSLLPSFKKQTASKIIVLSSQSGLKGGKEGSLYSASKFALRGFCQSLREETKQQNLAVTLINPGMVSTPFFQDLHFSPGAAPQNSIHSKQIATLVQSILNTANNCVVAEINLEPMQQAVEKNG